MDPDPAISPGLSLVACPREPAGLRGRMFWTFNCPQRSYQQLSPRTVQGEDRSGGQAVPTLDPLRGIMGSPPSSTPQASALGAARRLFPRTCS